MLKCQQLTIVVILTFISMINKHLRDLKLETSSFVGIVVFFFISCSVELSMETSGPDSYTFALFKFAVDKKLFYQFTLNTILK